MVQVDIVWSYAFGASFAAAAARQLAREEKPFQNRHFTFTLLFLSCLFAPSGMYLLWRFPHWETMQVATCHADIPAWLVVLFAVTNITQGILGYWTTFLFIKKGRFYAAHANWMVAWVLFWFILVCGWDCTGWQRFLYDPTMNHGVLWTPGTHMGIRFFAGNVFIALLAMAVFFAPALVFGIVRPIRQGFEMDPALTRDEAPGVKRILLFTFPTMFGTCLLLAIVAALTVMGLRCVSGSTLLGYLLGVPLFSIAAYLLLFRERMPMYLIARQLFVKEPDP